MTLSTVIDFLMFSFLMSVFLALYAVLS